MKCRTGFVSNSSSSSFIVAFPKKPEGLEELGKLMFGDKYHPFNHVAQYDYVIHQGEAAQTVLKEIQEFKLKGKKLKDRIIELCSNQYYTSYDDDRLKDFEEEASELRNIYWDMQKQLIKELKITDADYKDPKSEKIKKYNKAIKKYYKPLDDINKKEDAIRKEKGIEQYNKFMKANKGKFLFITSYSDNDGEFGCVMEHGGIFDNLTHITISQH